MIDYIFPLSTYGAIGLPLSDDKFLKFLVEGYLTVMPSKMTKQHHDRLYKRAQSLYTEADKLKSQTVHLDILGDNLRALIPEIDDVIFDPIVVDTLTSLLGENYVLHPHHYLHKSGTTDQGFHQDGNLPWNERGHYRSHRPDWALLFYYPQAVDSTNGATEVVAASQYWTKDFEKGTGWYPDDSMDRAFDGGEDSLEYRDQQIQRGLTSIGVPDLERRFVYVPQGEVLIGSYDLIHRGSRSLSDSEDRFMYKFYFLRTTEPQTSSSQDARIPIFSCASKEICPVAKENWKWSKGFKINEDIHDASVLSTQLMGDQEHKRVEAAYLLGASRSDISTDILIEGLYSQSEGARRASGYGLRIKGSLVTDILVAALKSNRVGTQRVAAFALGTVASAISRDALRNLSSCLESDQDDLLRSNAAYSLGQIARARECDVQHLAKILINRLEGGVEKNNTSSANFPRSTVRESVAYALLQLLANHQVDQSAFLRVVALAVNDNDRYVSGLLLEVLSISSKKDPVSAALVAGLIKQRRIIGTSPGSNNSLL